MEILKNFFVLEGLDGSGTTTQLELLDNLCHKKEVSFYATCEPSHMAVGELIRSILKEEICVMPQTLAYLFAADRNEHIYNEKDGIVSHIERGEIVITDRYLFSSLAYQGTVCDYNFVFNLNKDFPLPEKVFFLDLPVEESFGRLSHRSQIEIYDDMQIQKDIRNMYLKVFQNVSGLGMEIYFLNGLENVKNIHEKIVQLMGLDR